MERLIEGVKVGGDGADLFVRYMLGIRPGIWTLTDSQAEVIARILARKADEGHAQAIAQVERLIDYADYVLVAAVGLEKIFETIGEVKENGGINPFYLKGGDSGSDRADR